MYRSEIFFGPNGTSLRAKIAKRCDDKGPKRPECPAAGRAHFAGQLTSPCIYDMSTRKPQEARIQGLGGGKDTPFLNPETVEAQGDQSQLYEKSTEKGFF